MENDKRQLTVVIGLIRDAQGNILLQKRVDPLIIGADQKWEFPGGRVDYGETPEEALKRECQEEVGCVVSVGGLLPKVLSRVWQRTDGKEQHVLVLCYEAKILGGEPRAADKKVSEAKWFSKADIADLDTLVGIKEYIDMI